MTFPEMEPHVRAAGPWRMNMHGTLRTLDGRCPLGCLPNAKYATPSHFGDLQLRTKLGARTAREVALAADNVSIDPDKEPELATIVGHMRGQLLQWCGL